MKKLLQINTVVNYGSTGRIAEEIGITAMNAGWESYIAYGRYPRESKSKLIKIGNEFDQKMHGLQTRLFDRHGLASRKATKKLIDEIRNIQPNIIHLHNLHGYYLNIELLFKFLKTSNTPVIWTLHDCWPITGHCVHFTFAQCDKWKSQCYACPEKKTYPSSIFLDRSTKNYQLKKELFTSIENLTLIPVSKWLKGVLKESFLKRYPAQVIYNGIDTRIFNAKESGKFRKQYQLENKFIILGVTNVWNNRKGLQDIHNLSKNLDENFQIVLIGLTDEQIEKLPDNIIGIARTESVEMLSEIYATSDVFINTTYEDTFPTTNLEALACGTPVITYNTGGSPEAIDTATGIVVEPGNLQALKTAIHQIQSKGKATYSQVCIQRAHQLYKKEDRYKEYVEVFNELVETECIASLQ